MTEEQTLHQILERNITSGYLNKSESALVVKSLLREVKEWHKTEKVAVLEEVKSQVLKNKFLANMNREKEYTLMLAPEIVEDQIDTMITAIKSGGL